MAAVSREYMKLVDGTLPEAFIDARMLALDTSALMALLLDESVSDEIAEVLSSEETPMTTQLPSPA